MKKLIPATLLLLCLALLGGCATANYTDGRDFDSSKITQIVKAKTTTGQLVEWFGSPSQKDASSDGGEVWVWQSTHVKSHAQSLVFTMNVKTERSIKRLSVGINNGVVQTYTYTDEPSIN